MQSYSGEKHFTVYSTAWCPDCKRAKRFLGEQHIAYINIDIEQEPAAMAYVEKVNNGKRIIPTIVFPRRLHPCRFRAPLPPGRW